MNKAAGPAGESFLIAILWMMIAIYAASRVLQVYPGPVPMLAVVALHVFPPAILALIHGAAVYGRRAILIFILLCLFIGNIVENVGVLTGFPFGRYYFTGLMGPKILNVNVMLGLAYVGMGYLSWVLGAIILGELRERLSGSGVIYLPLVSAFIMLAWDFSMDPIWSTVKHAWIWLDGGPYFGVPISNFLGWYGTVYLIYQSFAIYLWRRPALEKSVRPIGLRLAVLFYAASAAGNLLLLLPSAEPSQVTDAAGGQWKLSSITAACALASALTMAPFALLAWIKSKGEISGVAGSSTTERSAVAGQ